MEYKKLLVYAPTQQIFEANLANEIVDKDAIAFIESPREIWAQGTYFPCPYSKEELDSKFKELSDKDLSLELLILELQLKDIETDTTIQEILETILNLQDDMENNIEDLAESIYYYHASATISANKTLIERGVNTSVTLTAKSSFKNESANTLTIRNVTAGSEVQSTGSTASKTATVQINSTTLFLAIAAFDYNITKTANVTVTAKYPIYTFGSTNSTVTSDIITSGKKAVKSSPAGSYSVTLSLNLTYFWICVPSEMTVNKVTLSGFDVPMESYTSVDVTGKDTYKCYRSTNTNDAGVYTLVVS